MTSQTDSGQVWVHETRQGRGHPRDGRGLSAFGGLRQRCRLGSADDDGGKPFREPVAVVVDHLGRLRDRDGRTDLPN
jgi:hypothetical protein